jgi:5-methylcytosine-specific restriction endonuclease McrA
MKTFTCNQCGIEFKNKQYHKYCSRKCYAESMKMNKICKLCGKIIENKHSAALKHRIYCSKECQHEARRNTPLSEEWKKALSEGRKKSIKCKGKNLYNWKGGKENQKKITLKRYYSKKGAGVIDFDYLQKLIIKQNNKCFYCECDLTNYKAIEHLTPLSKGGTNEWHNLVYSCKSCNSKKNKKTLFEFSISENIPNILNKTEQFEAKFNF